MRRTGQSPFQGRYEVPVHDYSPISEGGDAWGQALAQVGQDIGAGIKKYKLDQEERGVLAASLTGKLKVMLDHDPSALIKMGMDKNFSIHKLDEMKLSQLRELTGMATGYSAEAERQIVSKARQLQLENDSLKNRENIRLASTLDRVEADIAHWKTRKRPNGMFLTNEEIINNLTTEDQIIYKNRGLIRKGQYTTPTPSQQLIADLSDKTTEESLRTFDQRKQMAQNVLDRATKKQEIEPPVEDDFRRQREADDRRIEEEKLRLEALRRAGSPQAIARKERQNEQAWRGAEAQMKNLEARTGQIEDLRRTAPDLAKALDDNDKKLNAAYLRKITWVDADGKTVPGTIADFEKANTAADGTLKLSSTGHSTQKQIKTLERKANAILQSQNVYVPDDAGAGAGAGADVQPTITTPTYEAWLGGEGGSTLLGFPRPGVFGFGGKTYADFVDYWTERGRQWWEIAPPPAGTADDRLKHRDLRAELEAKADAR